MLNVAYGEPLSSDKHFFLGFLCQERSFTGGERAGREGYMLKRTVM